MNTYVTILAEVANWLAESEWVLTHEDDYTSVNFDGLTVILSSTGNGNTWLTITSHGKLLNTYCGADHLFTAEAVKHDITSSINI